MKAGLLMPVISECMTPNMSAIQLPWLHIVEVVHSEITDLGNPAFMA